MSVWGHIAGMIRVDGMDLSLADETYVPPKNPPVDIGVMTPDYDYSATDKMSEEEQEAYYAERSRQWKAAEDSGIPMGSEGSITWEWLAHKRGDHQYDGRYVISGDLRDYEDAQPVFDWVQKIVEKIELTPGMWVRQVAIQVEIEGKPPVFIGMAYNNKKQKEELIMFHTVENGNLIYAP